VVERVSPLDEDMTVTDSDPGGCPYCDATSGVTRVACDSPKVQAWWCSVCEGTWWFSVVNPRPARSFLEQLTASVELTAARLALREIITLADQAPTLTDEQLRFRLRALAHSVAPVKECR
jgi:transposase-like protein